MKNKVLIELSVPNIFSAYEVYIPINERVDKVIEMLLRGIEDITNLTIPNKDKFILMNAFSGKVYNYVEIIRNTDVRNGTKLVLIQV